MNIGITAGCWDLLHAGHILFLRACKAKCDHLIVLLQTDPTIDRPTTKNSPVESLYERQLKLKACKYVDEVIIYTTEAQLYHILKTLPHNVRFLGSDYRDRKDFTGYDLYAHMNNRIEDKYICYIDRSHNYSSSGLRKKIIDIGKKK